MLSYIFNWILYILKSIFQVFIIVFLILLPFSSEHSDTTHLISNGFYIGAFYNYWNYVIETSGRESNMLVIYDKSREYGIGVFEWWVRLNRPHSNVDYYHLNVNPSISGLKDPHTFIPYPMAYTLQLTGASLRLLNKAAPFVFAAFLIDDYMHFQEIMKQNSSEGVKEGLSIIAKYVVSWHGATFGVYLGTKLLPGVGSLIGSLVGATAGRIIVENMLHALHGK
uniref:Glycine zipper family protein n=1 Tax=Caenorhabditis tropicalis TaxID=1561998 RepID=A0A1I7UWD8_9PELO